MVRDDRLDDVRMADEDDRLAEMCSREPFGRLDRTLLRRPDRLPAGEGHPRWRLLHGAPQGEPAQLAERTVGPVAVVDLEDAALDTHAQPVGTCDLRGGLPRALQRRCVHRADRQGRETTSGRYGLRATRLIEVHTGCTAPESTAGRWGRRVTEEDECRRCHVDAQYARAKTTRRA